VATSDPTLVKITAADNSGILLNKDKFRVDSGRHLDPKLMEELQYVKGSRPTRSYCPFNRSSLSLGSELAT
jgi:hypothetical protein